MDELVNKPSEGQPPLEIDTSAIVEAGRDSLAQLGKTFHPHWTNIIKSVFKGRTDCMRLAHSNKPIGSSYNSLFATWMDINGFGSLSDSERRDCFKCVWPIDYLKDVTTWWSALPDSEKRRWNYPQTVFKKWKETQSVTSKPQKKKSVSLKEEVIRLQAELDSANEKVKEFTGYRVLKKASAKAMVQIILDGNPVLSTLSRAEWESFLKVLRGARASDIMRRKRTMNKSSGVLLAGVRADLRAIPRGAKRLIGAPSCGSTGSPRHVSGRRAKNLWTLKT